MSITYDYYRIFYYVAKYKSFTQAARLLYNNQPNITRSMNNLEHELGCRLFVRSNRGVTLTPEGETLYAHVSIAFEQIHNAEMELADSKGLQKGIITLGASETALHSLVLSTLRKFHRAYPGIRIRISNHSTPQAISALKAGLSDFAVVTTPTNVSRPLIEIPLKPYQEILVASQQFSFLKRTEFHLEDILKYPFICLGKHTKTYEFYRQLFLKYNLNFQPDIEASTTDQILPMIQHDLGIGFIPKSFAKEALEKEEVFQIPLVEPIPERSICLIKDTSHPLSIAARELEKMILKPN